MGCLAPARGERRTPLGCGRGARRALAERSGEAPPAWTLDVGAVAEPLYLIASAGTLRRTRERMAIESPEPLRRRNIFVPAGYATYA